MTNRNQHECVKSIKNIYNGLLFWYGGRHLWSMCAWRKYVRCIMGKICFHLMSTWPSERPMTLINLCQSRSIASLHSYTKTCITNYGHVWLPRRKDSYLSIVMYVMSSSVALMLAKTTADDTLMQSNTPNWQKWKLHTCQWRSSVKSQTHRNCHEFVQLRMQKPINTSQRLLTTWKRSFSNHLKSEDSQIHDVSLQNELLAFANFKLVLFFELNLI